MVSQEFEEFQRFHLKVYNMELYETMWNNLKQFGTIWDKVSKEFHRSLKSFKKVSEV